MQVFSSELQFISLFMKLFHLERFVIYGVNYDKVSMLTYLCTYLSTYKLWFSASIILEVCKQVSSYESYLAEWLLCSYVYMLHTHKVHSNANINQYDNNIITSICISYVWCISLLLGVGHHDA